MNLTKLIIFILLRKCTIHFFENSQILANENPQNSSPDWQLSNWRYSLQAMKKAIYVNLVNIIWDWGKPCKGGGEWEYCFYVQRTSISHSFTCQHFSLIWFSEVFRILYFALYSLVIISIGRNKSCQDIHTFIILIWFF